MNEVLDDEIFEIEQKEKVSFWRWWERKRFLFNLLALVLLIIFLLIIEDNISITSLITTMSLKFYFIYLLFANIAYTISLLLAYSFKWVLKKIDSSQWDYFSQNIKLWKALFVLQFLIFLFLIFILIIIGSGSEIHGAPFPTDPF